MNEYYVQAVLALLSKAKNEKDTEKILNDLRSVLEKRGHTKMLPRVLKAVVRELPRHTKDQLVLTMVNDSGQLTKEQEQAITEDMVQLTGDDSIMLNSAQRKADPTLIGGYTLTTKNKTLDRSHKQQLLSLYRNITT